MSRIPPAKVEPVIYKEITYTPSLGKKEIDNIVVGVSGHIIASDNKTNNVIWQKDIYTIDFDPAEETDVQVVYISKLFIESEKLIVINEHNERFEINPENGEMINN